MKSLRRTILVFLFLLFLGAAGGGTYVYIVWSRSDEMLRQSVHEKLAEIAPGWNIAISEARFNLLLGQVHLYDVTVPGDDPAAPLLEMPEVVLVVDRDALTTPNPEIRRVRVIRPRVHLVRNVDGDWNFLRLPPLRNPMHAIPEFRWEQATVTVRLDQPNQGLVDQGLPLPGNTDSGKGTTLRFTDVGVAMIPSGKREFLIKTSGTVPFADEMTTEGTWNMADRSWSVKGAARQLRIDKPLLELAALLSPDVRGGMERLAATADKLEREAGFPVAGKSSAATAAGDDTRTVIFSAAANVQFRIAKWGHDKPTEHHLSLQVVQGEFDHPALRYPLTDLRSEAVLENGQVELKSLSAKSGGVQFRVDHARIQQEGELRPADFDVVVTDLPLDERLYRLLPTENRGVYDSVQPSGRIDARLHFEYNGHDRWDHEGEVTVRDCAASHVQFPYRVERINGTIKRTGELIDFKLAGQSGPQRINLRGRVKNPGPEAQALFYIEANGLPIDEKLRSACPRKFQDVIDRLKVQGELDGWVRLTRPAGLSQAITPYIKAKLRNGAVNLQDFPIPLAEVTGDFEGTPNDWVFKGFRGRQDVTELTWSGGFRNDDAGLPELELNFDVKNAACDRTLFAALPSEWQAVWTEINPQGMLRAAGRLEWNAGAPPRIRLDTELHNGKLALKSFPIPLDEVHAEISHADGIVTIKSLKGKYNEARFAASGSADFPEPGEWHLHLADMHIDDLEADGPFRKALPPGLKKVVGAFNPQGKLSILGTLDFRGKKKDGYEFPVTAAWSTETIYTGNTLTAGIDLKDMYGKARFTGTWDGSAIAGEGRIELDSVKVLGYQLAKVSGPVSIDDKQLIVGSKELVGAAEKRILNNSNRLTAQFIEGQIGLDAVVDLGDPMRYRASLTLQNGELKRYAQSYMSNNRKLAGLMNGWVDLQGEGTDRNRLSGAGRLVISPAALYDLPLIVAVFQALTLTPPKNTAFDQAQFVFDVRNSLVQFQKIDLVGDAIHLVGRGGVRFNGAVNLDFYSTAGRNQVPIPLVREIIKMGTTGWVGVKVGGTVQTPLTEIKPLPQIDATLRQLLGNFEPRGPSRR